MTLNTTTVKVLEAVRDQHDGAAVKDVKSSTNLGDTTIRKALDELVTGGFLRKETGGGAVRFFDVHKSELDDDDTPEGGESMSDTSSEVEPEAKPAAAQRAGRPRDPQAVDRDEAIFDLVQSGEATTTAAVADKLGITPGLAYLSIWRLKKEGRLATGDRNGENRRQPAYQAVDA